MASENKDKLIDISHEKIINSALNKIKKSCNEITNMGYIIYVAEHGSFNVINNLSNKSSDLNQSDVVANIQLDKIDSGAW